MLGRKWIVAAVLAATIGGGAIPASATQPRSGSPTTAVVSASPDNGGVEARIVAGATANQTLYSADAPLSPQRAERLAGRAPPPNTNRCAHQYTRDCGSHG